MLRIQLLLCFIAFASASRLLRRELQGVDTVQGLTDAEIAAFGIGEATCINDDVSTGGSELCGCVEVSSDGNTISITSNSVPSHGKHLSGYQYRDIFRGFCLEIVESGTSPFAGAAGDDAASRGPPPSGRRDLQTTCSGSTRTVPANPVKKDTPTCIGQMAGIALDGVQLWNQYAPENIQETQLDLTSDADGVDAGKGYFAEPMDACSGHPGPNTAYHYHKLPANGLGDDGICFADVTAGISTFLAVAADGFPIYGPYHEGGEYIPADLDECNGIEVDGRYRYIATADFPYGPGCFWGEVDDTWAQDALCWMASDWLALVEGSSYYEDCDTVPVPESDGTQGCLSYYSNLGLYQTAFGSLDGWCCDYADDCGVTEQWNIDCAGVVCDGETVVIELVDSSSALEVTPTEDASLAPTAPPTVLQSTENPSKRPSRSPSRSPTTFPTASPTVAPTKSPSVALTSSAPTKSPALAEEDFSLIVKFYETKLTCHNAGQKLSQPCNGGRGTGCSYEKCTQYCFSEPECNFFFHITQRSGCILYKSCEETRTAAYSGTTVEVMRD